MTNLGLVQNRCQISPPTKAGQAVWVVVDEKEVFVVDVNLIVGEDIHHIENEHLPVVEDMHQVQDVQTLTVSLVLH